MSNVEKLPPWKIVHIPEHFEGKDIIIGIDEAGRGPVLGPLVYAAAFWLKEDDEVISKLGFNDSKQLSEADRESLMKKIIAHGSIGWVIEMIDAVTISEMLQSTPISLNAISYDAVIRALKKIKYTNSIAPEVDTVYVDTVGDPEYYKSRLIAGLAGQGRGRRGRDQGDSYAHNGFIIEKKADAKYKVVSAASIVAKTTRDRVMRDYVYSEGPGLQSQLGRGYGSGYPGDEACVGWMQRSHQRVFGYPQLVRFSWGTTKEVFKAEGGGGEGKDKGEGSKRRKVAKVDWECDEDESQVGLVSIKTFFTGGAGGGTGVGYKQPLRSSFFTKRKIARLNLAAF